jgi:hypothetical protein
MLPTLYVLAVGQEEGKDSDCIRVANDLYQEIVRQFPDFIPAKEHLDALMLLPGDKAEWDDA